MSVTVHARESGATVRCNSCKTAAITTGQVSVKAIRSYAASLGWIRGLCKRSTGNPETGTGERANGSHDICPACAPDERERDDARRRASNERRAKRDEMRKLGYAERIERRRAADRERRATKRAAKAAA